MLPSLARLQRLPPANLFLSTSKQVHLPSSVSMLCTPRCASNRPTRESRSLLLLLLLLLLGNRLPNRELARLEHRRRPCQVRRLLGHGRWRRLGRCRLGLRLRRLGSLGRLRCR